MSTPGFNFAACINFTATLPHNELTYVSIDTTQMQYSAANHWKTEYVDVLR